MNYVELQKEEQKPGLYKTKKKNGKWDTEISLNGQLQERKINLVAISDRVRHLNDAAMLAPSALTDSSRATDGYLESNGFDLHFTPGNKRIGGLRNLQQAKYADTDASLHESAILLADTMSSSRDIKDVTWVSEQGGSGVLTQAMRILKECGINFKDAGHKAFFSRVQTNLGNAEQLARDIGIKFDGKTHSKDWFNVSHQVGSGLFGGFVNPIKRRFKDDKYSNLNMVSDISKEVIDKKNAYATIGGVSALATGLQAKAVILGTSFATLSGPGMVFGAVVAAAGAAVPIYKGANAVIKSYFPIAHQKKITGN